MTLARRVAADRERVFGRKWGGKRRYVGKQRLATVTRNVSLQRCGALCVTAGRKILQQREAFFFSFFLFLEVESVICLGGNYDFDKVERGVV